MHNSDALSSSWRKSSFSEAGNCVEVAGGGGLVLIRDTKLTTEGDVLSFSPSRWREFIDVVDKF
jgi:Domain of unknown function (DUF397)